MSTTQLLSPRPNGRLAITSSVRAALALIAGLMVGAVLMPSAADAALLQLASSRMFNLQNPTLIESSGVAYTDGVYWTHNDGPVNKFYAVNHQGSTLGVYSTPKSLTVRGSDWEDIAAGRDGLGRPSIYLGDIGDNGRNRKEIAVIRVGRPSVDPARRGVTANATQIVKYRFRYPDGAKDAESLLVQPGTNRMFIVTKAAGGAVYAAPSRPSMTALNTLTKVGTVVIPGATAADFSPDGSRLVVRQYKNAAMYKVTNRDVTAALKSKPVQFAMPSQAQGESISFRGSNSTLVLTSEGRYSPVLQQVAPTL